MKLRRFIPVYGGKRSIATKYPEPKYDTIIEPFAGGAGYAVEYYDRNVRLLDIDERVCSVWDYLIHASSRDIMRIPIGIYDVDEIPDRFGQAVKYLVGWWFQPAAAGGPAKRASSWAIQHAGRGDVWGEKCRARIADSVQYIRHWTIDNANYDTIAPRTRATWFVDPPYVEMGVHYKHGANAIDFEAIGNWCRSLRGQVMVCENEGADWLPFEPLCEMVGGQRRRRTEVVWLNEV